MAIALVLCTTGSVAAAGAWTIVSSPNKSTTTTTVTHHQTELDAVSCPTSTFCMAVGHYLDLPQPLTESWDGSAWTIVDAPAGGTLVAVSCTSATFCMAVGSGGTSVAQTFAEQWNGTSWSVTTSPNHGAGDNGLNGVSCLDGVLCMAVGYYDNGAGTVDQTLAEEWLPAVGWQLQATQNANGNYNLFHAVSCASVIFCMAVGEYADDNGDFGTTTYTLVNEWNGVSWSRIPSPTTATFNPGNSLKAVSCPTSTFCMTVGTWTVTQTLAEQWNGAAWIIVATQNPSNPSRLLGVACTAASFCAAVGDHSSGLYDLTLVEQWDGTSWTSTPSPSVVGSQQQTLRGVSCVNTASCTAVGFLQDPSTFTFEALVERWDGTQWSTVPSPSGDTSTTTTTQNQDLLSSVSCVSGADCFATGSDQPPSGAALPLIERWDGSHWTPVISPVPAGEDLTLSALSCTSANSCMAAGYTSTGRTLVERWDGSSWSIMSSADISGGPDSLSGVSCTDSMFCAAVGHGSGSSPSQALVEHWNGTSWQLDAAPTPGQRSTLAAVSCASSKFCAAVGGYTDASSTPVNLIEQWDGYQWSIAAAPSPSASCCHELTSVSCPSTSFCMAFGTYYDSQFQLHQYFERWNGTTWTVMPATFSNMYLGKLSCLHAAFCVAAGVDYTTGNAQTLVEEWDGTAWAPSASQNSDPTQDNSLSDASCAPDGFCAAVGNRNDASVGTGTLVEHRSPAAPPPPAIPETPWPFGLVAIGGAVAGTALLRRRRWQPRDRGHPMRR